jgi:acyl-coenzyme A synthetase/AMP-(fatty) acid ligase
VINRLFNARQPAAPLDYTKDLRCPLLGLFGREDQRPSPGDAAKTEEELKKWVSTEIGPIARPDSIEFRDKLPKTRSGKIMRRLLKAEALGKDVGDISTLDE